MRVLCVAEKPSIAKSITEILSGGRWDTRNGRHQYIRNYDFLYNLAPPLGNGRGANFTVTAVLGHLTSSDFDDDHRKWGSCDPFALFDAPVITFVDQKLKTVESNLQIEARNADILMIWTDCDREGEHIGSEVVAACKKVNRNILVKRARFSAIIPAQIHQACRQANDLDMRQADAVATRISLDLKVGSAFTRLTTMTLQVRVPDLAEQLISYGPCQFPTLGFVVEQYTRVQAFVPETFWYIFVALEREHEDGEPSTVEFRWKRNHLFDLDLAAVLYEQCTVNPQTRVLKVESKPATKWKPLPLTTVELQQSGSRLLHMTPKRILDLAEKLYQKGIVSYPRTETDQYDPKFDFNSLIQKQTLDNQWGAYAQKLLDGAFQKPRNGRKNDKAHPPIHPTAHAGNLEGDERRVFELITRRFLASCSTNAEGQNTTVEISIADEIFSTTGLVVLRRNYLEVYPYDKWATHALPNFEEGEVFIPDVIDLKEGTTSRPSLLTEADLVGLMDKNGIGTDATIAEHIAKIIERGYVTEKQEARIKYLVPSTLGIGLVEGFNAIGFDRSLSKPHLRRETEHRMQLICDGVRGKREILQTTIEEYKEVFVKARREFQTVIDCVENYLHGAGEAQEALRAAARGGRGGRGTRGARGARGGRGTGGRGRGGGGVVAPRGGRDDDNDDDDDDDDDQGPPRGGVRERARGAATTRGRGTSTARGRAGAAGAGTAAGRRAGSPTFGADDGGGDTKMCNCGREAVSRVVAKADSAHKGRSFWTCPQPQGEQCGFFEWGTDGDMARSAGPSKSRTASAQPPPSKRQKTTNRNDPPPSKDGVPSCKCGLDAAFATVIKEGPNKGRQFWACPNNPKARCGFFQWEDDPNLGSGGSNGGDTYNGGGGRSGTSGECYKCGEAGHWANACPNDGDGKGGGSSSSRAKSNSKALSKGKSGDSGSDVFGACYKCGEQGHWATNCPNNTSGGGGGFGVGATGDGISGHCFKCNQPGHWASNCPNDESGGRC